MREASFIKKNKEKWLLFENILEKRKQISPKKLTELYLEVTDDLSYARTYYPNSNTYRYLNSIANKAHQSIYKVKRESKNRFISFFLQKMQKGVNTRPYSHR